MNKFFVATLFLLLATAFVPMAAQEVVWSIDFGTVFNNREGGDEMRRDQTFFFSHLSPELGLQLMDSVHILKGGVTWLQPINNGLDGHKVLPTLYYQYRKDNWQITAGMFSRTLLVERAPRYLWSDSLNYEQPHIRGLLVQHRHARNYGELFLDWRQLQTTNQREAFNINFNGRWYPCSTAGLWVGGSLQLNHLAKSKHPAEHEGVNDDITINPMAGYDQDITPATTLQVKAGVIINQERARIDDRWHTACGFVANARMRWKCVEAEQNIFAGKDLFPLYPRFGNLLNLGDTYYRDNIYSRTDVIVHIVQNRFVDLNTSLSLHATNKTTGFWQQISCRVYIDSELWKQRRDKQKLKSPRLLNNY